MECASTVRRGNVTDRAQVGPELTQEKPYKNEEILRDLYVEKRMTQQEVADELGCCATTVRTHLLKSDIPLRGISEAKHAKKPYEVPYRTREFGHEVWKHSNNTVLVHRLLAVAKYGLDELRGYDVHHINGVHWDNRPDNITLLTNEEHGKLHKKFDGIERIRIAELYENGKISSRKLADWLDYDISMGSILGIHKEFYQ